MNSYKISLSSLHMRHFITYEYIYEFMYMKNIMKIDDEIIPEIMCTKVPHDYQILSHHYYGIMMSLLHHYSHCRNRK